MRELTTFEIEIVSGGDGWSYWDHIACMGSAVGDTIAGYGHDLYSGMIELGTAAVDLIHYANGGEGNSTCTTVTNVSPDGLTTISTTTCDPGP